MAVRTYEDDAQQLDPAFHLIGEVERQFADRIAVEEFRKGTEVKFSISDKRPAHYNYRFWKDKQSNRIHVECYKKHADFICLYVTNFTLKVDICIIKA